MKTISRLLCLCLLTAGAATSVRAVPIPYADIGVANSTTYTFVATGSGPITAYFVGQDAYYGSRIGLSINGATPTSFGLQNHTPAPNPAYGTSFVMGYVKAGDVLRFVLAVNEDDGGGPMPWWGADYFLNSDASRNPNGANHIYSSAYAGDSIIPAGTYVGFEDVSPLGDSDRDYNDHQFVFAGPGLHSVPEGGTTLTLMGVAVLGLVALRRWLA
jgi:hypothetical protein